MVHQLITDDCWDNLKKLEETSAEADRCGKTFKRCTESGTEMQISLSLDVMNALAKKAQASLSTLKKLLVPCLLCSIFDGISMVFQWYLNNMARDFSGILLVLLRYLNSILMDVNGILIMIVIDSNKK